VEKKEEERESEIDQHSFLLSCISVRSWLNAPLLLCLWSCYPSLPCTVQVRTPPLPSSPHFVIVLTPLLLFVVGAYRLCTDSKIYQPIWTRSRQTLKRASLISIPLILLSLPLTRLYVVYILSRSPLSPKNIHDAQLLGVSPVQYTTWMLVLGQVTLLLEWMLKRELKKSRTEVYDRTVQSRGKRESETLFTRGRALPTDAA